MSHLRNFRRATVDRILITNWTDGCSIEDRNVGKTSLVWMLGATITLAVVADNMLVVNIGN